MFNTSPICQMGYKANIHSTHITGSSDHIVPVQCFDACKVQVADNGVVNKNVQLCFSLDAQIAIT